MGLFLRDRGKSVRELLDCRPLFFAARTSRGFRAEQDARRKNTQGTCAIQLVILLRKGGGVKTNRKAERNYHVGPPKSTCLRRNYQPTLVLWCLPRKNACNLREYEPRKLKRMQDEEPSQPPPGYSIELARRTSPYCKADFIA